MSQKIEHSPSVSILPRPGPSSSADKLRTSPKRSPTKKCTHPGAALVVCHSMGDVEGCRDDVARQKELGVGGANLRQRLTARHSAGFRTRFSGGLCLCLVDGRSEVAEVSTKCWRRGRGTRSAAGRRALGGGWPRTVVLGAFDTWCQLLREGSTGSPILSTCYEWTTRRGEAGGVRVAPVKLRRFRERRSKRRER